MLQGLFAVHDSKAECYVHFFAMATAGQAIRSFEDLCKDPGTPISRHPDDFRLFRLGSIDDDTGELAGETAPVLLATGEQATRQHGLKVAP